MKYIHFFLVPILAILVSLLPFFTFHLLAKAPQIPMSSFSTFSNTALSGSTPKDIASAFQCSIKDIGSEKKLKKKTVLVTAYSSTPDQTDDSPFVTASNSAVRDGVLAANFLPFGTRVLIPEIFGNKVFVVEDRMHSRMEDRFIDVWMASREHAKQFGVVRAEIVILD